jgi:hypothetical protein
MRQKGEAVVFVQCNDNLAVTVAFEVVFFGQLCPIFFVAVKLAIDHSVDVVLVVMERLVSIWTEIDDRQSHMTESC